MVERGGGGAKNQMQVTVYQALRGGGRNQCWRKLDLSTMRVLAS